MSDGIDFIEADFGETNAAGGAHHLNNSKPPEHWDKWILKNTRSPIWPLFFLLMCSLAIFAFPIVIEMMLPKAPEQQAHEDQLAAQLAAQQQQGAPQPAAPQQAALPEQALAAPQSAYGQMAPPPQSQPTQFQQAPQYQQAQFQSAPHPSQRLQFGTQPPPQPIQQPQQASYSTDAFYATPVYDTRFGRPAN